MGLFDLFRKKPSHEEKVQAAYSCFKPEIVDKLFLGGKRQANNIITSLGVMLNLRLDSCDKKDYLELLTMFAETVTGIVVFSSSNSNIMDSLQSQHSKFVKTRTDARNVLSFFTRNMNDTSFSVNSADDMRKIELFSSVLSNNEQTTARNRKAESEFLDDPEYGLVPNKPIYTNGARGSDRYLSQLKTILGEPLSWNRSGSMSVDGIEGMVDIYDSSLPSGRSYKTLYVNMYGSNNSTTIPRGFSK